MPFLLNFLNLLGLLLLEDVEVVLGVRMVMAVQVVLHVLLIVVFSGNRSVLKVHVLT